MATVTTKFTTNNFGANNRGKLKGFVKFLSIIP